MRQAPLLLALRVPLRSSLVQGQNLPLLLNTNVCVCVFVCLFVCLCACVRVFVCAFVCVHFLDETEFT